MCTAQVAHLLPAEPIIILINVIPCCYFFLFHLQGQLISRLENTSSDFVCQFTTTGYREKTGVEPHKIGLDQTWP